MEALKLNRRRRVLNQQGFSMVEMLIATVILSVGLLSLAGLMSKMDLTTHDSRYMSAASLLASEKMEELASLASYDPAIDLGSSHSAGSLTSDTTQTVNGDTVSYYDQVSISALNGSISETKLDADGKYFTIGQDPYGNPPQQDTNTVPPAADEGAVVFKRRWLIEDDLSGFPSQVRRVTVLVEYPTGTAKKAKFQISMVRNGKAK